MKKDRVSPFLIDIVQTALLSCEGVVFDSRDACPVCGGRLSGYDTKKKQFAVIIERDTPHPVNVFVKRFSCRACHALCFADEPFYPDTRIGSPVVDLSLTLAERMPFHRSAAFLEQLGIQVDRGTIRNYALRKFPEIPTTDLFGILLPLSIISLSEICVRSGEGSRIEGAEVLAACGLPSAYRAAPDRLLLKKEGSQREKEEDKEKRQAHHPENDSNSQ
jgi:RNA polymerase subunit RPABC4/transcription elongation factor Spt4